MLCSVRHNANKGDEKSGRERRGKLFGVSKWVKGVQNVGVYKKKCERFLT